MGPIFIADSIGKSFRGRTVLNAASVWACAGCITLLVGRNGCGKSTLLNIGAGLLTPDFGVVRFAGEAYERPRLHHLASRGLFYLPDRGLLSRRLTVREHIAAIERRFGKPAVDGIADGLELGPLLDRRADALSGGERRRSEFALAALRSPTCLLADEPLSGIGPTDAAAIAATLRRMAENGVAVVVTGHEVPELLALADEVIWMTAGTTHGLGSPDTASRHDQFRREYLGPSAIA